MLRFKQFAGAGPELEAAVNAWLAEYEPEVTTMTQTPLENGMVVVSFLFEESFRAQELRLVEESQASAHVEPSIRPGELKDEPLEVISESIAPAGGSTE
jgi:hypothetical protein